MSADDHPTFWCDTLERECERGVQTHGFIHAGIQVGEILHLIPFWEWASEAGLLIRFSELVDQFLERGFVSEEVVDGGAHDHSCGIRAGDDI
jgi:hypothetical protein